MRSAWRSRATAFALGIAIAWALSATGCTGILSGKKRVWIYTSLYKEVIAEMKPIVDAKFPDLDIRWYQGGSENVAARVNTELFAGRTQADLILTSDPFWYLELKHEGKLAAYESPAAREVPAEYRDPDGAFATVRICVMVIGYHPGAIPAKDVPTSWSELSNPRFERVLSMGSPVESGTTFTAAAMLTRKLGWDWLLGLRKAGLMAAGGNSSVIQRIESRERPVGMVLLENILKARKKSSPVFAAYPTDGSIPVPSPIALMRDSRHPEESKRVYDWFFSDEAQLAVVRGLMYSPFERLPSPTGAMPWKELRTRLMRWDAATAQAIYAERGAIKARLSAEVLR